MSIQDSIKQARITSSASSLFCRDNKPNRYTDSLQRQYCFDESSVFDYEFAEYSTDYVVADIQGLYSEEPLSWVRAYVRLADLVKASASMSNNFDDYKMILVTGLAPYPAINDEHFAEDGKMYVDPSILRKNKRRINYIKRGTKIETMGNTWLVTNPMNMSDASKAVIQRCNATWRYLDFYGNVCSEPICIGTEKLRANDPDSQRSSMITKGYLEAKAQYNKATKQLRNNSRMILGSSAYMLSGFSDFSQEFTDDDSSINMVEFALRHDEPNDALDDMQNRVANGKVFSWEILLDGTPNLKIGETKQITIQSRRYDEVVVSTEEQPIDYVWTSSDAEVVTVDENGNVTAVSEGNATITATLKQNPNKSQPYGIKVEGSMYTTRVAFDTTVPDTLSFYESVTIRASYYENGEKTDEIISWDLSGADKDSYSYTLNADNSITVKCWQGSVESLAVKASCNGYSDYAYIELRGF